MAQVTETTDERCDNCREAIDLDNETSIIGILMKPEGETTVAQVCDRNCWEGLMAKGCRELTDEEMQILREKIDRRVMGDEAFELAEKKKKEEGRA